MEKISLEKQTSSSLEYNISEDAEVKDLADTIPFKPEYDDEIDPGFSGFMLSMINPHCMKFKVVIARAFVITLLFICCLYASLAPRENLSELVFIVGSSGIFAVLLCYLNYYIVSKLLKLRRPNEDDRFWKPFDYLGIPGMLEIGYEGFKALNTLTSQDDIRETELKYSNEEDGILDERIDENLQRTETYWFDFVADVGDGFDSTYTVAKLLSRKSLDVEEIDVNGNTKKVRLPRGSSLIVGGDICYPLSNERNLTSRFMFPYSLAFAEENNDIESEGPETDSIDKKPRMYIAMGNHEWLDGLNGVREHILPKQNIGGWSLPQKSTYFSVRYPRGWWMFCVDIGPEPEDINASQREFFDNIVATKMEPTDTVIMVLHVPTWIKSASSMGFSGWKEFQNLCASLGDRLRLVLAGDIHYYKRMEMFVPEFHEPDGVKQNNNVTNTFTTQNVQLITAGHGGAFGHLGHIIPTDQVSFPDAYGTKGPLYVSKTEYPHVEDSEDLQSKYLLRGVYSSQYAGFVALVYCLMFIVVIPQDFRSDVPGGLIQQGGTSFFFYLSTLILVALTLGLLIANHEVKTPKMIGISLFLFIFHCGSHLIGAYTLRLSLDALFMKIFFGGDVSGEISMSVTWAYCFITNFFMITLSLVLGPLVSYVYYRVSHRLFNHHWTEIPCNISLVNQSHKGFMRIGIDENGDLHIYAVVIDKIPKYIKGEYTLQAEEAMQEVRLLEKIHLTKHSQKKSFRV